jgi:hypothetical protein
MLSNPTQLFDAPVSNIKLPETPLIFALSKGVAFGDFKFNFFVLFF